MKCASKKSKGLSVLVMSMISKNQIHFICMLYAWNTNYTICFTKKTWKIKKAFVERFGMSYVHAYFKVKVGLSTSKKIVLFALLKAI